jgi:hypothetical protein
MQEKYFLFQREDPSVLGGLSFSDNGNGISVLAIPASNVAYMSADRAKIIIFFNDSSLFEQSGLIENGESFEKTNVSVTCELGKEVELIEAIINFINRDTPNNFMRFDATGERNTFNQTTANPVIEARVRSRASKRGFAGSDAVVKGILPPFLIGGVDFMSKDKLPVIDIDGENIVDLDQRVITSIENTGNGIVLSGNAQSANIYDAVPEVAVGSEADGPGPICFGPDSACSTKTIGFQAKTSLVADLDILSACTHVATAFTASQTDAASSTTSHSTDADPPTIKVTTNGSGTVTAASIVYEGSNIEAGDQFVYTVAGSAVSYTVTAANLALSAAKNEVDYSMLQLGLAGRDAPGAIYSLSLSDYTLYITAVVPDGALFNPLYGAFDNNSTYTQGPFPVESLGNEFQLNHGGADQSTSDTLTPPTVYPSRKIIPERGDFSYKKEFDEKLTSDKNLFSFVIRRTKTNDIYIYDRDGGLVSFKEAGDDTDGVLDVRMLGLIHPSDISQPQPRIARFGVINKDVGDDHSRNIAIQLNTKYRALI